MAGKTTGYDSEIKSYVLWKPQYKQALAMKSPAFELFFGGAAGGGKSDFLLADFLGGVPGYGRHWQGILFRRSYTELEELLKRACELYIPLGARRVNKGRDFIFPSGALVKFRYLDNDNDVLVYQGHQYTWVGFDELGNYPTDFAWRYMISRCRSAAGVPCYMRGSGNPGGTGHAWIKARFIDGFEPYKIHKTVETAGAASIPVTRCYIPSKIEDNPALINNDPDYLNRMKLLPLHLYRALREGDWDIFAGQVFDEWRRDRHAVKPFALPQDGWRRFYAFDWGFTKPYALVKLAVNYDGKVVQYGEIYGCRKDEFNTGLKEGSPEVAAKAREHASNEGVTDMVADPASWNRQDNYPAPITAFQEAGFRCVPGNNDRKAGLQIVHDFLKQEDENGMPMFQVFDVCVNTVRTLPALTPDPHNPEDIDSSLEDHLYDAIRYGLMSRYARHPRRYQDGGGPARGSGGTGRTDYSGPGLEGW